MNSGRYEHFEGSSESIQLEIEQAFAVACLYSGDPIQAAEIIERAGVAIERENTDSRNQHGKLIRRTSQYLIRCMRSERIDTQLPRPISPKSDCGWLCQTLRMIPSEERLLLILSQRTDLPRETICEWMSVPRETFLAALHRSRMRYYTILRGNESG